MSQSGPLSSSGNPPAPSGRYPITPYVVGPIGKGGYQTIQSAINAANTAGGGVVYIQPGNYAENLTLYNGVDLYGTPAVSQNQGASTTITGTHTPPNSGSVKFNSICFVHTTAIISSVAAGSTHFVLINCESAVQNGYFFNLLNWTGTIEVFDHNPNCSGAPFAVQDGGINNTGGATFIMFAAGFGFGSTNTMNLSGAVILGEADILCPVNFGTGSSIAIDVVQFTGKVTFSGNSTGSINTSRFTGGVNPAITMSSSANIKLAVSIVDSTNNPAITGAGAGNLELSDITFLNNSVIANTVTISYPGPTEVGTLYAQNISFNRGSNTLASNGQLIIGKTGGVPQINNLTAGSGITITNGPGSITIASSSSGGVTGPGSSTDNALARWDGAGGTAIQNSTVIVTDSGQMTNASQPAFLSKASLQSDVTGDNTAYTVVFNTVVFNQGSNFDGTSTFTAPVTGKYSFSTTLSLTNFSVQDNVQGNFVSSNGTYLFMDISSAVSTNGVFSFNGSILLDMDIGDTIVVKLTGFNGSKTIDVTTSSWFSGNLVC